MLINAKISLKLYTIYSLILLSTSYLFMRTFEEFKIVIIVFLATCANHRMLIYVVRTLSEDVVANKENKRNLVPLMIVGKILLVTSALIFGVQIMGKRIIIPVLIYVMQIVVLYLSFEKQTSAENGS